MGRKLRGIFHDLLWWMKHSLPNKRSILLSAQMGNHWGSITRDTKLPFIFVVASTANLVTTPTAAIFHMMPLFVWMAIVSYWCHLELDHGEQLSACFWKKTCAGLKHQTHQMQFHPKVNNCGHKSSGYRVIYHYNIIVYHITTTAEYTKQHGYCT